MSMLTNFRRILLYCLKNKKVILKKKLLTATIIAALGSFLFGFDTAVISGTTDWLKIVFDLSPSWLGFTAASALIGTIIGSILVGKPADYLGRRNVLFILAIF